MDLHVWFLELVKFGVVPLAVCYIARLYLLSGKPDMDVKLGSLGMSFRRPTARRKTTPPRYRQAARGTAPKSRKQRRRRTGRS